jgi:hypothetical protein
VSERHEMTKTCGTQDESLFVCSVEGCDRQLVLNHIDGHTTVIQPGQDHVPHQGFSGPVKMTGEVSG